VKARKSGSEGGCDFTDVIIALQFFLRGGELKDVCLRPYTVQRTSRTVYDKHEALTSMLVMMIMIIVLLGGEE